MVKTPTYHVFDLYQVHQENDLLASSLETEQVGLEDEYMVPNLTESVSVDANGVLHITMTNVDLEKAYPVEAVLLGKEAGEIKAEIVTGHMQDKNTFEAPETVGVQGFDGVQATKRNFLYHSGVQCASYRRKIGNHKNQKISGMKKIRFRRSLMDGNTRICKKACFVRWTRQAFSEYV